MPKNETTRRARALLDKKLSDESSLLARFRKQPADRSSADDFFSGLVEGAFLLATADGELSEEEELTLADTLREVTGDQYSPDEFLAMIHDFEDALREDGVDGRLDALRVSLPDEPARRAVLAFAALVALCDHHLADSERQLLQAMAVAFGFTVEAMDGLVEEIRSELG
jgi:tellurite resistance protein